MSAKQYVKGVAENLLAGAVVGLVTDAVWLTATEHPASLLVNVTSAYLASTAWAVAKSVRSYRQWQRVLASYDQPALGEGIEIPHRPPADDEQREGGEGR